MLFHFFVAFIVVQACSAALKKDCIVQGKTYKDGQPFDIGCTGRCTCSNGAHHCVSMCPPYGMPGDCRDVRNVGECCKHGECFSEVSSKKCDSPGSPGAGGKVKSPWTVNLEAGTRPKTKKCMATIIDPKTLITSDQCVSPNDEVKFTSPVASKTWRVKSKTQFPFVPHVRRLVLEDNMEISKDLHEINVPWGHFCSDDSCGLFLTSLNAKNETEFVQAKRTARSNCGSEDRDPLVQCLEIPETTRPSCTHMDGSGVAVRRGPTFYIIGVLMDGPTPKDSHQCDSNRNKYRKYINMCNKLNDAAQH
jgi:hypothetical protein